MSRIEHLTVEYVCPCGARMLGKPVEGKPWLCASAPHHTFELKSVGLHTIAEVIGGGEGIVVHKRYLWEVVGSTVAADQEGTVTVKGTLI